MQAVEPTPEAVAFFLEHATTDEAHARTYAADEAWFKSRTDGKVEWEEDNTPETDWMDEAELKDFRAGRRPQFVCFVSITCPCPNHKCTGRWVESLFGIDLGTDPKDDDPYKRVVVAELAGELKAEFDEYMVD